MAACGITDGSLCWIDPEQPFNPGDVGLAEVPIGGGKRGNVIRTLEIDTDGAWLVSEHDDRRETIEWPFRVIAPVVRVQAWSPLAGAA
jgi:SOS-response transcriptional repressor LexA